MSMTKPNSEENKLNAKKNSEGSQLNNKPNREENKLNHKKNSEENKPENRKTGTKTKKPVLRRLLLIIIGLILGLNLYFANAGGILGNQLPMPFGYGLANVLSGSMEPTFSKGTLLLVKDTRDVQEGDIVVYQSGRELIVHRIIALSDNEVITQGDANNVADEPFAKAQLKGKVIAWIPVLGSVAALLKTPVAIIVILLLAFLLIEGSFRAQRDADDQELEAIKEEIRRLKEEKEKQ